MHSISSLCLSLVQRVSVYVPRARLHTNMCVQSLNFHLFTWSSIFEGTGAIFFPAPHFRSLISSNFHCCTRHFEIRFHTPFYRRLILEFPNIWNNFFFYRMNVSYLGLCVLVSLEFHSLSASTSNHKQIDSSKSLKTIIKTRTSVGNLSFPKPIHYCKLLTQN